MPEAARQAFDRGAAAGLEPVIDVDHLARMTFGEERLRVEVLALFDRQAGRLLARIAEAAPREAAAFAHTLLGSARGVGARGVGAWTVAAAAAALERVAVDNGDSAFPGALERLTTAVGQARIAARELLADCEPVSVIPGPEHSQRARKP